VNPSLPSSLLPSVLPSLPGFIHFYSVEESYFSAAPSSSLAAHQQRLKQLPLALQSNEQALTAAVTANEPADIGALYLERKRLMAELERMRREEPPAADILEVRQTMQLPMGFVEVEGKLFFLQSAATAAAAAVGAESSGAAVDRRLTVAQVHQRGVFKPEPFASGGDGSDGLEFSSGLGGFNGLRGSNILGRDHTAALRRLFDGKPPHMGLLYSARRDGGTTAAFHQKCDGRGPTFTVIRCGDEQGTIVGGWAGESWNSDNTQYSNRAWLFNLGSKSAPLVCRMDPAQPPGTPGPGITPNHLQYGHVINACMFGTVGQDLTVFGSPLKIHSQASGSFWSDFSFQGQGRRRRGGGTKPDQAKRRRRTRRRWRCMQRRNNGRWAGEKAKEEGRGYGKWKGGPNITAHGFLFSHQIRFSSLLSLRVCLSASVAAGFDPPSSVSLGGLRGVETVTVAPHDATVEDMEVYTCALDERNDSNNTDSSNTADADAKKKRKK